MWLLEFVAKTHTHTVCAATAVYCVALPDSICPLSLQKELYIRFLTSNLSLSLIPPSLRSFLLPLFVPLINETENERQCISNVADVVTVRRHFCGALCVCARSRADLSARSALKEGVCTNACMCDYGQIFYFVWVCERGYEKSGKLICILELCVKGL